MKGFINPQGSQLQSDNVWVRTKETSMRRRRHLHGTAQPVPTKDGIFHVAQIATSLHLIDLDIKDRNFFFFSAPFLSNPPDDKARSTGKMWHNLHTLTSSICILTHLPLLLSVFGIWFDCLPRPYLHCSKFVCKWSLLDCVSCDQETAKWSATSRPGYQAARSKDVHGWTRTISHPTSLAIDKHWDGRTAVAPLSVLGDLHRRSICSVAFWASG